MTPEQKSVLQFHNLVHLPINQKPEMVLQNLWQDRIEIIDEEFMELLDSNNVYERADALGDLLYVVYGAAVISGIDLEPVFNEIHRSNMTKLWTWNEIFNPEFNEHYNHSAMYYVDSCEGMVIETSPTTRRFIVKDIDNNKAIKSPSYSQANLKPIIDQQLKNGNTHPTPNSVGKPASEVNPGS